MTRKSNAPYVPPPDTLAVRREEATRQIQEQLNKGLTLLQSFTDDPYNRHNNQQKLDADYGRWRDFTSRLLQQSFTSPSFQHDFDMAGERSTAMGYYGGETTTFLNEKIANLQSLIEQLPIIKEAPDLAQSPSARDDVEIVKKLCNRFHSVARQLRSRHGARETIEIEDEYDVQDLLHSLLKIEYDDVRAEEWTPSYAGGSARTDFLLKSERIVIEVKKTRGSLTDRDLGDQLIIDIARYQAHPDCERLVCFVYDPEGRVGNPRGLENDLSKKHGNLGVLVVVAPKVR